MKRKKTFAAAALIMAAFMGLSVGCNSQQSDDTDQDGSQVETPDDGQGGSTPETPKTYTITFKNGDEVVKTQTGKTGEFVEIPEAPQSSDPRIRFVGWQGVDAADAEAGRVEIFAENQTFSAIWYEQFGTDTTFTATKVRSTDTITVDGELDAAYSDAVSIPVTTVSAGETDTTATAYLMWDDQSYYIFVDVKDDTVIGRDAAYSGEQWTEHNDAVEIWMDILHDDSSHGPSGYSGGFGGAYRGEPGPMCEAQFKINPGAQYPKENNVRYGADSEFGFDGWWSNEAKNDGVTVGTTKITETGYTVEYKINTNIAQIPEELRPAIGQEIGIGIKVYDKTVADEADAEKNNPAPNQVTMENIAGYMSGPKKLSNVRLVANASDTNTLINVKQVRDCYAVTVDGTEDMLYKDALESTFGTSKVKMLWDASNVYVIATLGEDTNSLKFETAAGTVELTPDDGMTQEFTLAGTYQLNENVNLEVTYQDAEDAAVTTEYLLKMQMNDSNIAGSPRKMYEAKKLAEGERITVDGQREAAYGTEATVIIDKIVLTENNDGPKSSGKAWIVWDDTNLYIYVEVKDENVSATQIGDAWQNDSVEVWLNTCRSLPTSTTIWGTDRDGMTGNRVDSSWCGEGGFRVLANGIGDASGQEWLWDDNKSSVDKFDSRSVLIDGGYAVEYKIFWGSFVNVENKVGEVIDFIININDDDGDGAREGIVSSNTMGNYAWEKPYVLDHLKLVAAD